jgi:hypothetical protein
MNFIFAFNSTLIFIGGRVLTSVFGAIADNGSIATGAMVMVVIYLANNEKNIPLCGSELLGFQWAWKRRE